MKHNYSLLLAFALGIATSTGVLLPSAYASWQPHMDNAMTDLHHARKQLEMAERDKGGHREAAIGLVDQAIGEVQAGIAAGN